jgi:hypothetical protein
MRENIFFVEWVSLTDIWLVLVNLAQQLAIFLVKKRAWKGRLTTGSAAKALSSSASEAFFNDLFFEQHQIAALNLHLERCYNLLVNLDHSYSKNARVIDYNCCSNKSSTVTATSAILSNSLDF